LHTSTSATRVVQWKQHSDITVTGKNRTFAFALSGQLPSIRAVIDKAIAQGKVRMLFDHQYSPVGPAIKQLAHASLSEAAKDLHFDADSTDICARLEFGDNDQYIKPIVNYVS
jgi:hypothetical protein